MRNVTDQLRNTSLEPREQNATNVIALPKYNAITNTRQLIKHWHMPHLRKPLLASLAVTPGRIQRIIHCLFAGCHGSGEWFVGDSEIWVFYSGIEGENVESVKIVPLLPVTVTGNSRVLVYVFESTIWLPRRWWRTPNRTLQIPDSPSYAVPPAVRNTGVFPIVHAKGTISRFSEDRRCN